MLDRRGVALADWTQAMQWGRSPSCVGRKEPLTMPTTPLCCATPKLTFDWVLGVVDEGLVLRMARIRCLSCGRHYAFKTNDGVRCPVRHADDSELDLQVMISDVH